MLSPRPGVLALHDPEDSKIVDFARANAIPDPVPVRVKTLWPKSTIFYVACDEANLRKLEELATDLAGPELCMHLDAYTDETVLLDWSDAWDLPILLAATYDEQAVAKFATAACGTYEWIPSAHAVLPQ